MTVVFRAAMVTLLSGCAAGASNEMADLGPGEPAPAFTLPTLDGRAVSLSDHVGKTVVLEWFNPGCPYVVHAYSEGALKEQPARVGAAGVVWLAINSGAPGKQGHGVQANQAAVEAWGMTHSVLLDESGATGRAYGARTTPGMVVIDPAGNVAYVGALDNAPSGTDPGDDYVNYVDQALADLSAGRPVATARTRSYGCSVKYGT